MPSVRSCLTHLCYLFKIALSLPAVRIYCAFKKRDWSVVTLVDFLSATQHECLANVNAERARAGEVTAKRQFSKAPLANSLVLTAFAFLFQRSLMLTCCKVNVIQGFNLKLPPYRTESKLDDKQKWCKQPDNAFKGISPLI